MICLDLSLPNFQECQIFFDGVENNGGYFCLNPTNYWDDNWVSKDTNPNYLGGLVDELGIGGSDLKNKTR